MHADVGTIRPMGHQQGAGGLAQRNIGRAVLQDLDLAETLAESQDHKEGLTLGNSRCLDQGVTYEAVAPHYWCS